MDSVVVSRGGERERESLSVLSFLLAIHRQRERRVVCLNRRLIYLLFICCVGVGVVVKATFRERDIFFSFLFFFVSPSFVFFFFFDNNA